MTDGQPSAFLRPHLDALPFGARILDAGGWLQPLFRATHVADYLPYQTRRGRLQTEPVGGENFTAETWMQSNFLAPDFRLPVEDKFFDFAYCSQTVEDLTDPVPLLRELNRVARAGVIESPSRLTEQTVGVRDRMSSAPGHAHHHWILDTPPNVLELCPKRVLATLPPHRRNVPLLTFERLDRDGRDVRDCHFAWRDALRWIVVPDTESCHRANALRDSLHITWQESTFDAPMRLLRRLKSRLLRRPHHDPSAWFQEMLKLSAPFMTPPAKSP